MEEQKKAGQVETATDRLLCKSQKAKMKRVYLTYICVAAVVVAFQVFVYLLSGFHILQALPTGACLIAVVVYTMKTKKDADNWLHLYEWHFEIKEGRFSYATIREANYDRDVLTLNVGGKRLFYVANAEELCQTILQRKERISAKRQQGV